MSKRLGCRAAAIFRTRRPKGLGASLALAMVGVVCPAASASAFSAGTFAVRGGPLVRAGNVTAGRSVTVYLHPVVVSVDGCRSGAVAVRVRRRAVAVSARLMCAGIPGAARLVATIRGTAMSGRITRGKRMRRFTARLAIPKGVLLAGKPGAPALAAVRNTNKIVRHPSGEVSPSRHVPVLRTELVIEIARGAKVADVNAALAAVGGRIAAAVEGSPILVLAIPDPGSVAAIDALRRTVARMRGIRRADRSVIPGLDALPDGFGFPLPTENQTNAIRHLIAMRMPAAWNAREAIQMSERPLVIVADKFGNGPLNSEVDVEPFNQAFLTTGTPSFHGYHVTGIIAANFKDDGTAPGLVTGVFPKTSRLLPLDITLLSMGDVVSLLELTAELQPGHLVLNTSIGYGGGSAPEDVAVSDGSDWATVMRREGLDGRMVQATSAGNMDDPAIDASPWTAAALEKLKDPGTGHPIADLPQTMVVENIEDGGPPDYKPGCRWTGPLDPSNYGGTIAGVGLGVYSDSLGSSTTTAVGTSQSSPQAAGLAEYLWSIDPDLTAEQVAGTILRTAAPASGDCPANPADPNDPTAPPPPLAPHLDAYTAVLSLDQPGCFIATCAPVRFAILDRNGDGHFNQDDLKLFADDLFKSPAPTDRDWSRSDLNGDGFTGGDTTAPFDMDTTGSVRTGAPSLGTVTQTVHDSAGNAVQAQFDEKQATDADILCYYAYSRFYEAAAQNDQRDTILGDHCAPVEILSCSTSTDFEADADVGSDTTGVHKTDNISLNPPQCLPSIGASKTLNASDSGTCNVPQTKPCSASSSTHASILATASANDRGASIRASFTGTSSASFSTGGSAHGDIDGDADTRFRVNVACSYSVSGTASSSSTQGGSASSGVRLGGGSSGTIFHVDNSGSDAKSGTLQPGTYFLDTSGVGDASTSFGGSTGDVGASGFLTLRC